MLKKNCNAVRPGSSRVARPARTFRSMQKTLRDTGKRDAYLTAAGTVGVTIKSREQCRGFSSYKF
jgi:hypothetical protein